MTSQSLEQIEKMIEEKKQSITDNSQKELFELILLKDEIMNEKSAQTLEVTVKSLCDNNNKQFEEIKSIVEDLKSGQIDVKDEIVKMKKELGLNGYKNR